MSDQINARRRRLLGTTVAGISLMELGLSGFARAQLGESTGNTKAATRVASFENIRQVDAGTLSIGYAEAGPQNGPVVILLHGWPYDIYSFAEVTPLLVSAGYRVIMPYLRGYGSTRFLSADTPRNGQQAVVAVDIIALMDALKIDKAILGGFDWGARTVNIIAALWPQRCMAMVSVSGYLIGSQEANRTPLPPKAELAWWYQFYFATDRGRAGYAWGCFLPYVFGGFALGNANISRSVLITDGISLAPLGPFTPLRPLFADDAQHNHLIYGYTAGLGVDVNLVGGLFLRAEWEYVRFTAATDTNINTVRAGLGYKF